MNRAKHSNAIKAALPLTLPVLAGYAFLGMAYGLLMHNNGLGPLWTLAMSALVFAGSLQYVSITLLIAPFNPLYALLFGLMINARHLFYGLSMLDKYRGFGKLKPLMVFFLADEAFSIVCSAQAPEGVSEKYFLFYISLINYLYWVIATVLGNLVGGLLTFNTTGLDFALTALFVVIFVDQWLSTKRHLPAMIGVVLTTACLLIFGRDSFLIPAMAAIVLALLLGRKKLSTEEES